MGVLNVTPDSFSDGGRFQERDAALYQAEAMVREGAAFIDVGGESTRPGAAPVSVEEELDRVCPIVEAIAERLDVVISIDTSTPQVIRAVSGQGAGLINDVRALRREGALEAAAESGLPVCLMHMQGEPQSMQRDPQYSQVVGEVRAFLQERIEAARQAGVADERILLDPGFGFGKSLRHNLQLLRDLETFTSLGYPLLVGLSRKSMLGQLTGREVDERLAASITVAVLAAERGARIIRVHDVRETVDAMKVVSALEGLEG
ncbi:dihydropteroate synthase [Marinobacteraceae bacterium S3BR75-40.1]